MYPHDYLVAVMKPTKLEFHSGSDADWFVRNEADGSFSELASGASEATFVFEDVGTTRVRAVRSSGLVCSTLANVGLDGANAPAASPGCTLNSNRKRTHVYTLCAGALHGALAGRVQPVKRAARDRGSTLSTR